MKAPLETSLSLSSKLYLVKGGTKRRKRNCYQKLDNEIESLFRGKFIPSKKKLSKERVFGAGGGGGGGGGAE